jgi:two-component system cell cycle sensor histidine kinase/response regulator CckA
MRANTVNGCSEEKGGKAILLVEDEEMVSEVTERILERSGYTVITAANGKEALNIYEEQRDRIALVILDLILPGMGGKQCLQELRRIDPNLKVVVTSGHPVDSRTKETIESLATCFVRKPFNVKEILQAVREVLNAK